MLSILIPVFNYDILSLVEEIHQQVSQCQIDFEIIIIDDASNHIKYEAKHIKIFSNTKLIFLKENIGRSAIRNVLASKANYENLLFIDAGTIPKSKQYITNYLREIKKNVVIGGMIEEEKAPPKPYKLRWLYTKTKERNSNKNILTSTNFLIKKSVLENYPFDETIITYGYEDVLFFNTLKFNNIQLHFINNPVIHDCMEDANTFIYKTEQGLENLFRLSESKQKLIEGSSILKLYTKLNFLKLKWLIAFLFKQTKTLLVRNFNSSKPSIILFDFYKLGYFCTLKQKR